jgi:hypothetical protein
MDSVHPRTAVLKNNRLIRVDSARLMTDILQNNRLIGTDRKAISASSASFRKKHDLSGHQLTLRIVTPDAPKGTSLKENRGPDTRPVMNGVFLYVKYSSRQPPTAP